MRFAARTAGWVVAALVSAGGPALADGWSFRAGSDGAGAGFVAGGAWAGLWFVCEAGQGSRLMVSTGGARLPGGVDHTAVIDIDGTAFLQFMRIGTSNGEPILQRRLQPGEMAALADAIARGRKADVSMPAGHFGLPLRGSGKALASFRAACR